MLYQKKVIADTAFAASIVLSILITTIGVSRILTSPGGEHPFLNDIQNSGSYGGPLSSQENGQEQKSSSSYGTSQSNQEVRIPQGQPAGPSNVNPPSSAAPPGALYGGSGTPGYALAPTFSTGQDQNNFAMMFYASLYQSSPYILPISWGAVAGTLIWRGKVRSQWCKQGYDYDTFRLLARMKGSPLRVALLTSVTASAKTRSQLAQELCVDWKTIDNHVDVLSENRLIQEIGTFGTSRYFAITEQGRRVLSLLLSLEDGNNTRSSLNEIARESERTSVGISDDSIENSGGKQTEQPVKSSLN